MNPPSFIEAWSSTLRNQGDFPAIEDADGRVIGSLELEGRVARVAARLSAEGLGPGHVVASKLGRSIEAVTLLLGCWRAGVAWLPLDPAWPTSRVAAILRAARASRVMESADSPLFSSVGSTSVVAPVMGTVAYVIATSGTTGTPRLVQVPHGGVVPMLRAQAEAFALRPGARVLSALSTGFDATLSDWGTALLSAATLVLAPPRLLESPAATLAFLRDRAITHADLPPALLPSIQPETLPSTLETVIVGGEASAPAVLRRWAAKVRVVSVYGPTEATVCCSLVVVDPATWDRPLVGEPVAGTTFHIAPDAGADDTGELYIGGPLLADGYLGDPVATAGAFGKRDDSRWFRTGDRVRRLGDGRLEFLGRVDTPLKLSGHRVSLAEIEAAIGGLAGVRGVVARPVQLPSGRWIASVTCESGERAEVLKARALDALPSTHVPARWRVVDELPRNVNGKLARSVVEEPRTGPTQAISGPSAMLADAWESVLGVRPGGDGDRFDLLGGDSLACLELSLRLASAGHIVDPVHLSRHPGFGTQVRLLAHHDALPTHHDASVPEPGPVVPSLTHLPLRDRRGVLVTGAAGFVGRALVRALLESTDRPVFALFRALPATSPVTSPRFIPLLGDVRERGLGIDHGRLASVGAIVHLAADLSLVGTDERLSRTNVDGTANVVELARLLGAHLHHVSTLSVFTHTPDVARSIDEDTPPPGLDRIDSPYARTKRRGEALVQSQRGLAATTWRPGLVLTTDESGGVDHFSRVVRGLARLKFAPDDLEDARFDVTSRARLVGALVAALSLEGPPPLVHVAGDRTFSLRELREALTEEGIPTSSVSRAEWQRVEGPRSADVLVAQASLALDSKGFNLFEATRTRFDTTLLRRHFPSTDRPETLRMYVRAALGQP